MSQVSCKFGEFELDSVRYELRRNGRPLKLERIPMDLLMLLAEKGGNVVSRQEIIERLWGKDVFVDTEHGINTAIRKVRSVLREDADRPRFVRTVQGKGYQFVAQKNGDVVSVAPAEVGEVEPAEAAPAMGRSGPLIVPLKDSNTGKPSALSLAVFGALALLALAAALVGMNVAGWRDQIFARRPNIQAVAVLPLANLSGDTEQEFFADGMTEALITELGKIRGPRVISRQSVMEYKGSKKSLAEIARELNVDAVLEGAVELSGERVRVTIHLSQASPEKQLWPRTTTVAIAIS